MKYKLKRTAATVIALAGMVCALPVSAAGSGSAVITPTSVTTSTANTMSLTYTAAETIRDGKVQLTIPDGWTPPSLSGAGKITVSPASALSQTADTMDLDTGWQSSSGFASASSDSGTKVEGSGSIAANVLVSLLGSASIYKNTSVNWSTKTSIGVWVRPTVPVPLGELEFWLSESSNLPDNGTTTKYDFPALPAFTWTYVQIDLSGSAASTRDSVASYGFNFPLDAIAQYNFDHITVGPQSVPGINGRDVTVQVGQLSSGQTLTIEYQSATAGSVGQSEFIVRQSAGPSEALAAISSSPVVTVTQDDSGGSNGNGNNSGGGNGGSGDGGESNGNGSGTDQGGGD